MKEHESERGPKTRTRAALALAAIGVALLAGLGVLRARGMWPLAFQQSPGPFDRERWEAVVAEVRALNLAPGETRELRLGDLGDPRSLRARRPEEGTARGRGAGNVWAEKTPGGKLKVVIETRDLGHAGEYGFAYSEVPLSPVPFGGAWQSLSVPGHLQLVLPEMRIDDHWWQVVHNLD